MTTMPAKIIHVSIQRGWREVYAFAANPENIRHWASGLASGLTRDRDEWVADGGPIGEVRIRFAPQNGFGVIDHEVTLKTGQKIQNPMRITQNGDGSEVMFTLLRQPEMTDDAFSADAAHILRDLQTLKSILEK